MSLCLSVETGPITLSVVMPGDVMLNVVMLSVVAPWKALKNIAIFFQKNSSEFKLSFSELPSIGLNSNYAKHTVLLKCFV
jgi:hypothetical protein